MKLPSIFKIWDNKNKIWRKSGNGLQMWSNRGTAENVKSRWRSLLDHMEIKEFYLLPKDEMDCIIMNDLDDVPSEEEIQSAWERFGKDFDEELSGVISNYDRNKMTIVSTIFIGHDLSILYYVFLCDGIYYRITTKAYWRKNDRVVIPGSCAVVELKYQLAYKFVRKDEHDSIASVLGL